ncbi:uncharacterized protein NECHADRAFT_77684 [Fusarium vanettenii 77-13-4]|uniref:Uncharacterized protein n=1 Tax=Fusarium vanettenii (strain ATCC MYA-4622 / CBS 123669 / FGSC 9596 / NRRL 45880 / 77-13-4) TaxID=660122 RepID=C7YLX3_FUSV7|nr:uncharacterized protein NECHADRAFT_77684 [Fusarium vanettenii 77-13-4]EEU46847.1 predicted protein [Fusarium vanettenii 77-13-4]
MAASNYPSSTFTTTSIPDIHPHSCIAQILTVPYQHLDDPFHKRFVAGYYAISHLLSLLVPPEDWVRLSASNPRSHVNLRYGNKDVGGICDNITVHENPSELADAFLDAISAMSLKASNYCQAGYPSSLVIIICGPTSLHQDMIRELPYPLTPSTKLHLLTVSEIQSCIDSKVKATLIAPSMLCTGWVVNQSLGVQPARNSTPTDQMLRMIARNVASLYQVQASQDLLGPNSKLVQNRNGQDLSTLVNTSQGRDLFNAVAKSCRAFLSIATPRCVFNFYSRLDDWSRLSGVRLGEPLDRFWPNWQLLPHAKTDTGSADGRVADTTQYKRTQALLLTLLYPSLLPGGDTNHVFQSGSGSMPESINAMLDQIISAAAHHFAMVNLTEALLNLEHIPHMQTSCLHPTEPSWGRLSQGEMRTFKSIVGLFPPAHGDVQSSGPIPLAQYIWSCLHALYCDSPKKTAAIEAHICNFRHIQVGHQEANNQDIRVIRTHLTQELIKTPTVARAAFDLITSMGYRPNATLLRAREDADIAENLGTELSYDTIETRRTYHE